MENELNLPVRAAAPREKYNIGSEAEVESTTETFPLYPSLKNTTNY